MTLSPSCVCRMPVSLNEQSLTVSQRSNSVPASGVTAAAAPPIAGVAEGLARSMLGQLAVLDETELSTQPLQWSKFDRQFLQTPLTLKSANGSRRLQVSIAGLLRALGAPQARLRGSTVNHWDAPSPERDIDLALDCSSDSLNVVRDEAETRLGTYLVERIRADEVQPVGNPVNKQSKKSSKKSINKQSNRLAKQPVQRSDLPTVEGGLPAPTGRALLEHFALARRTVEDRYSEFYKLQLGHKHADSHQIDLVFAKRLGVSFDVVHASSELHFNTQRKTVSAHHLYPASLLKWLDNSHLLWFHPQVQGGLARLNIKCTKGPQVYLLQEDLLPHLIESARNEVGLDGKTNALQQFAKTVLHHVSKMPADKQARFWCLVLNRLNAQAAMEGEESTTIPDLRQHLMDWSRSPSDVNADAAAVWQALLNDLTQRPLTDVALQRVAKLTQGLSVGHDFKTALGQWWARHPDLSSLIEDYFKEAHSVSLPPPLVLLSCLRDLPLGLDVRSTLCVQVLLPCVRAAVSQAKLDSSIRGADKDALQAICQRLSNPEHYECADALHMAIESPSKVTVDRWSKSFQGLMEQGNFDLCLDMIRNLNPLPLHEKLLLEMSSKLSLFPVDYLATQVTPGQDALLEGLIDVCDGLQEAKAGLSGRTTYSGTANQFYTKWLDVVSQSPYASHLIQRFGKWDAVCLSQFHVLLGAEGQVLIAKPGVEGMYKNGLLYLGDTVLKATNFNSDLVPYGRFTLKANGYPGIECERKCAGDPFQIKTQWSVSVIESTQGVQFFARLIEFLAPIKLGEKDETLKIKFEIQAKSTATEFIPSLDGFEGLVLNLCNEGRIDYCYPGKLERVCLHIQNGRPSHLVISQYREYELATLRVPYPTVDAPDFLGAVQERVTGLDGAELTTINALSGEVEKVAKGPYSFEMGALYGEVSIESKVLGFTYQGLALDMFILGDGVLKFNATGNLLTVPKLMASESLRLTVIKALVKIDKSSPHLLRQLGGNGLWNDSRNLPPADFKGFVNQEGDLYHLMAYKSGPFLLGFLRQKGLTEIASWVEVTGRFYWVDRTLGPILDVEILESLKLQKMLFNVTPNLVVLPHGPHTYYSINTQGEPELARVPRNFSSYLGYEMPDHPSMHSRVSPAQLLEPQSGQFKLCMGLSVPVGDARQSHHLELNLDAESGQSDLEVIVSSLSPGGGSTSVLHSPEVVGVQNFLVDLDRSEWI